MKADEDTVSRMLKARGLHAEKIPEKEARKEKKPDFRVFKEDKLAFYCEVKSIEKDEWLDNLLSKQPPGTIVGGIREDPIFNRLTNKIHTAAKQFAAINPDIALPNVLAFVNHDDGCTKEDLNRVLSGYELFEEGKPIPAYLKYAGGRMMNDRKQIHLFLWVVDDRMGFILNGDAPSFKTRLCGYFNLNPSGIKQR